jgi:hypothetical protein
VLFSSQGVDRPTFVAQPFVQLFVWPHLLDVFHEPRLQGVSFHLAVV